MNQDVCLKENDKKDICGDIYYIAVRILGQNNV